MSVNEVLLDINKSIQMLITAIDRNNISTPLTSTPRLNIIDTRSIWNSTKLNVNRKRFDTALSSLLTSTAFARYAFGDWFTERDYPLFAVVLLDLIDIQIKNNRLIEIYDFDTNHFSDYLSIANELGLYIPNIITFINSVMSTYKFMLERDAKGCCHFQHMKIDAIDNDMYRIVEEFMEYLKNDRD